MATADEKLRALILERLRLPGTYFITTEADTHRLFDPKAAVRPKTGDTVSVHPLGGGPPKLYELEIDEHGKWWWHPLIPKE